MEDGAHLSLAGQDQDTHAYFWICPRCQRKLITGEYIENSKPQQSDEGSQEETSTDETSQEEVSKGEETSQEVEKVTNKQVERKRHRRS